MVVAAPRSMTITQLGNTGTDGRGGPDITPLRKSRPSKLRLESISIIKIFGR